MRVITGMLMLSCLCIGAASLTASSRVFADNAAPADRPQPIEVPCMCQGDLRRAVLAQPGIPEYARERPDNRPRTVDNRLYRDGYRPVRNGKLDYWCRIEQETGSLIANNVRCELGWLIESEYEFSNRFL